MFEKNDNFDNINENIDTTKIKIKQIGEIFRT